MTALLLHCSSLMPVFLNGNVTKVTKFELIHKDFFQNSASDIVSLNYVGQGKKNDGTDIFC